MESIYLGLFGANFIIWRLFGAHLGTPWLCWVYFFMRRYGYLGGESERSSTAPTPQGWPFPISKMCLFPELLNFCIISRSNVWSDTVNIQYCLLQEYSADALKPDVDPWMPQVNYFFWKALPPHRHWVGLRTQNVGLRLQIDEQRKDLGKRTTTNKFWRLFWKYTLLILNFFWYKQIICWKNRIVDSKRRQCECSRLWWL